MKNCSLTLLTLQFCPPLTGLSFCARLTDAFACFTIHDCQAIVVTRPAVAAVALREVLLYGSAKVKFLHTSTLNLLHQL